MNYKVVQIHVIFFTLFLPFSVQNIKVGLILNTEMKSA